MQACHGAGIPRRTDATAFLLDPSSRGSFRHRALRCVFWLPGAVCGTAFPGPSGPVTVRAASPGYSSATATESHRASAPQSAFGFPKTTGRKRMLPDPRRVVKGLLCAFFCRGGAPRGSDRGGARRPCPCTCCGTAPSACKGSSRPASILRSESVENVHSAAEVPPPMWLLDL